MEEQAEMVEIVEIPDGFNHVCAEGNRLNYIRAYYNSETQELLFDFSNKILGPITIPQLKMFKNIPRDIFHVLNLD